MTTAIEDMIIPDELLLQAARNGNLGVVSDLLKESSLGKIDLNINCKVRFR